MLALIAFVLCVGAAIYVLLPHKLVFAFRGQALLTASDHEGIDDVIEAYRAAGIWIEPMLRIGLYAPDPRSRPRRATATT